MGYIFLTVIFFLIPSVYNHPKCCQEQNFIINGTCIDGTRINIEENNCQARFILPEDEFVITENNSLLLLGYSEHLFYSNQYCVSMNYETNDVIAVICENNLENLAPGHNIVLRAVCGLFSVLFILLTILVYCLVPQLRDLQGKCFLHTLAGLAIAFLSLALLQLITFGEDANCIFMAFLTYSSFLLAFFWLNAVSFNVWRNIVKPNLLNKKDDFWYLCYCAYAYGMTSVFVIVTLIAQHTEGDHVRPQFGDGSCFFNGTSATWAYFYGPISVLLIINIVLYTWSCITLCCGKEQHQGSHMRGARYRCLMTMKLFFIMGIMWIFEVISYATHNKSGALDIVWMITDYVNTIQGILIFFVLVVFRKKALRGLASNSCLASKFPRSWQTLEDEECLEEEEDAKGLNA